MAKAFLSHSSSDKDTYIGIVANKLGFDNCVYDEITFEEGMKPIEEIEKGLTRTDIFVVFLSEAALNSKWIKLELVKAHELLDKNIKRIYPIIIDSSINYYDKRIPNWMRKEYNLKYISRPTIAAKRIIQRLREVSWQSHPSIREKEKVFVGRNSLIRVFEERIDDFDQMKPICIIASGLEKIGRQALIKHCLKKAGIIDDAYQPAIITLDSHESIEDFILKLDDLGFSAIKVSKNLLKKKVSEKAKIATSILFDIKKAREFIMIQDKGCIVTPEGVVSEWFIDVLAGLESKQLLLGVASNFRPSKSNMRYNSDIFCIEIPELDRKERDGLLKRFSEMRGLELSSDDLVYFSGYLNGYPDQVFYAINLIEEEGLNQAKKDAVEIREYATEKVMKLLRRYEKNDKSFNFLCLLSKFEFISYNLLYEIVGEDVYYDNLLDKLFTASICEHLGANKEYIRVNYAVRDYLARNLYKLPKEYSDRLKIHIKRFLNDYKSEERDIADYLFSIKQALMENEDIAPEFLIPSHFLKTMIELYNARKYNDVIVLADRVLENSEYMDSTIKTEIRYYLCLSLARQQNDKVQRDRFLKEVMDIRGADHNFLFGFFYRLSGNSIKAIERLETALHERKNFPRAQRELVQVYLYIEDYEKALELARINYENEKSNVYHLHAYIKCLIKSEKNNENEDILIELLYRLEKIKSTKAIEMYQELYAQFMAFYKDDCFGALALINDALRKLPDSIFIKATKFNICEKYDLVKDMKEVIDLLEKDSVKGTYFINIYISLKSIYYAKIGKKQLALSTLNYLKNYPDNAVEKLRIKINRISNGKNTFTKPSKFSNL